MRAAYQNYLRKRAAGEGALLVSERAVRKVGLIRAAQLAMLMDYQVRFFPEAEVESEGWFPCRARHLRRNDRGLNLPLDVQTTMLNKLEQNGYIERKVRGSPPTRYLRINYDRCESRADSRREMQTA